MHEILSRLRAGQRVLDLGCMSGSFRAEDCAASVVRADLDSQPGRAGGAFVCCDARFLPFDAGAFDAVILNHSLEHFEKPEVVLAEIGRVICAPGYLWVAVPDASTITDRIYRWLGRGGGHVNQFTDHDGLVRMIEAQTRMPHAGTRVLFSSMSFLNRRNNRGKPRRLYLLGGGAEWLLRLSIGVMRKLDARFGTRTSVYGWGCCFGANLHFDSRSWWNVCIRCGSGHSAERLLSVGQLRRGLLGLRLFRCPDCGTENYFTDDG